MNRRQFMKAAGVAGIVSAASPAVAAAVTREPRQVVILCGESVRYDMLHCNRASGRDEEVARLMAVCIGTVRDQQSTFV